MSATSSPALFIALINLLSHVFYYCQNTVNSWKNYVFMEPTAASIASTFWFPCTPSPLAFFSAGRSLGCLRVAPLAWQIDSINCLGELVSLFVLLFLNISVSPQPLCCDICKQREYFFFISFRNQRRYSREVWDISSGGHNNRKSFLLSVTRFIQSFIYLEYWHTKTWERICALCDITKRSLWGGTNQWSNGSFFCHRHW